MKNAILTGLVVLSTVVGGAAELSCRDPAATELLRELYVQLIPFPGTQTTYGIPISLWNVPRFISWYEAIALTPQEWTLLKQALADLPVPVCGHAPILGCCQKGERELVKVCEHVRSALGLAKWLIHVKHFSPAQVRSAVDQWLHFVFSSYYLSEALAARGIDPASCGLPVVGVCVKGDYASGHGGCEVVSGSQKTESNGRPHRAP